MACGILFDKINLIYAESDLHIGYSKMTVSTVVHNTNLQPRSIMYTTVYFFLPIEFLHLELGRRWKETIFCMFYIEMIIILFLH
jgi:hypothetical protein